MKKQHIHLVGIKGVAMAALAVYLHESGVMVTGSDTEEIFPTEKELRENHIPIMHGFDPEHVSHKNAPDAVYFTGAHNGRDNIEVKTAVDQHIPVFPHGQALGDIAATHRQIVVSGCHGKTTTSAMIATILKASGSDPSYAIGCGSIVNIGAAGHKGTGEWMVIEGDEYVTDPGHDQTPRFLWLKPEIAVITNIDYDHPDAYRDLAAVKDAYKELSHRVTANGVRIVNADDPNSKELLREPNVIPYGRSPASLYQITRITQGPERMFFTVSTQGVEIGEFTLSVPGIHNVMNATAALIAAHESGISWETAGKGLQTFRGTARRFEHIDTIEGVTYIDDYAHHPEEIQSTLTAARSWFGDRKIIAVFQPHTYSRTKSLLSRFANAFGDADTVVITDIYASAREHDTLGITGMTLVEQTRLHHKHVEFCPKQDDVETYLMQTVKPGDVVLFMGAGDIYNWSREIVGRGTKQ